MEQQNQIKSKETVAQEALRLLKDIPSNEFLFGRYSDGHRRCCSVGHYIRLKSLDPTNYSIENCNDSLNDNSPLENPLELRLRSRHFLLSKKESGDIASVNNCDKIFPYNEPEIKDRVIHLLEDMVEAGY